jgi:TRAP-type C4-dicarboxylate transport system permease small subunit
MLAVFAAEGLPVNEGRALGNDAAMRTALDRLYLWAGYAAGFCLIVIFLIMMIMSAGRQFGLNIPSGDDFAAWAMAACAFLGLAHTFKSGEMIRVGLVIERFSGRTRHVIEILSLLLGLAFVGYFTWFAGKLVYDSYRLNDLSNGVVSIPLWIPQLGFAGGLAILTIAFLDELIHVLRGNKPRYEKEPPKTAEEAIARAIASAV